MLLINKIVVVTGGAGLLGKEFCKAIVANGGVPIIADIDESSVAQASEEIKNSMSNCKIDTFVLDITSKSSIKSCIISLNNKFGRIDALVNNAYPRNKNYGSHFFEVKYEDFCENIDLNIGGYFLTSQQFSKFFLNQGYGNIINISSIYGVVAPRFEIYEGTTMTTPVEYAAIKSALIHLTKYMAKYFKGKKIRVNSISPGGISDEQPKSFLEKYKKFTLNKGMLNATDIVGTLIYLLSDFSEFVNGQNIVVDDGFTL